MSLSKKWRNWRLQHSLTVWKLKMMLVDGTLAAGEREETEEEHDSDGGFIRPILSTLRADTGSEGLD